jgi:tetratricopeptide (TPR) repeat protein
MGETSRLDELRGLVQERRFVAAVRLAKALIDDGTLDPRETAEVRHICAVAYFKQEEFLHATTEAQASERLSVDLGLHDLARKVRVNLVALLVEVGEYEQAVGVGETFLADDGLPSAMCPQLAYVTYNVARAHLARRDKQKALDHFREAVRLGETHGAPASLRVQMAQQLAWSLYLDEHIAEADRHLEAAESLIGEEDEDAHNEQLLLSCVRAHQVGDMAKAVELAEELVAPTATATGRQKVWAYLVLGWVAIDYGRIEEAANFTETATERAISLNSVELMNRTNQLRHRIMGKQKEAGG